MMYPCSSCQYHLQKIVIDFPLCRLESEAAHRRHRTRPLRHLYQSIQTCQMMHQQYIVDSGKVLTTILSAGGSSPSPSAKSSL